MATKTIIVKADPDQDDCLAYAAEQYVAQHPEVAGWDLSARWADQDRETIALDVPTIVTDDQIRALRDEAGAAGDSAQVRLCDRALSGDTRARAACIATIETAAAMAD